MSGAGKLERAENIIAHRLPGIAGFHQGNVLVSGGMEYVLRMPDGENLLVARIVPDIADQRDDIHIGTIGREPFHDRIERELAGFQQDEPLRLETNDLAA